MSSRSVKSCRTDFNYRKYTSAQLEEQLVRRRQAEYERLNFWTDSSTYFRAWNFNTAQYSNWTSNEFYKNRMELMKKTEEKKKKGERLIERRVKLKELLEKEDKEYEIEMKNKTKKDALSLEDLKSANIEILMREEEKRRKERDLKMYYCWRESEPTLRAFQSKQHHDFVKKSWIYQVAEKKREREAEEQKIQEHIEDMKALEEEHGRIELEMQKERKRTEEELKLYLEKQIELIKCKEEQEKILKREEMSIVKAQTELEELLDERRRVEERRKRKDLSLFHKRQYLLTLKKRSQEVKENLEADRQFLEKIRLDEEMIANEENERMEKFRRELKLAREAFRKQTEVEKLKANQCEFLFEEEARKMLEKRDAEWKKEEEARKKLMDDVVKMIQLQIQEKLVRNAKAREDLQKSRAEMIVKMEEANSQLREHREKSKMALENWKKDLDQQILEKRMELAERRRKQEEDKENELRAKREEEEKLFRELSKMKMSGYRPKVTGRRSLMQL